MDGQIINKSFAFENSDRDLNIDHRYLMLDLLIEQRSHDQKNTQ
jgi:hypothetical protein